MAVQEEMFCSMTETIYNTLVEAIELALSIPIQFLESIKSVIRKVKLLIFATIESTLEAIEKKLFAFLASAGLNPDTSEQKGNFCSLLFTCKALRDSLFDPDDFSGDSDAVFVQFISLSVRNLIRAGAYDVFEKHVCKLSLRALIDNFIDYALLDIGDALAELRQELLDALDISALVDQYEDLLETPVSGIGKNVFELLDELDKFAQCAFGVCNFIYTSSNQQDDFATKAYIEKNGNDWSVNLTELTTDIDKNGEILLNKIDELSAFASGSKDKPSGISSDQVMLS